MGRTMAFAARTAEYECDCCDGRIQICSKCLAYLEDHAGFDSDGDGIWCIENGKKHIVPGCKKRKR